MAPKRIVLGESRLRARRRRRRLFVFGGGALIFFLILGIFVWLSWASFLRINTIVIAGTTTVDQTALKSTIESDLSHNYFYLFSKHNIFLYPKQKITQDILSQFTAIKTIEVHADDFHTLKVDVVERAPSALWCGEQGASALDSTSSPQASSPQANNCFLLDESGLVYTPSADYSGAVYRRYYGPVATTSLPKQFLTPGVFHSLSVFIDTLEKKTTPLKATDVEVDANSDVHVQFENNFTLLFALASDGGDVFERFGVALGADPFVGKSLSDFEYLDLRFGDKLYYKAK